MLREFKAGTMGEDYDPYFDAKHEPEIALAQALVKYDGGTLEEFLTPEQREQYADHLIEQELEARRQEEQDALLREQGRLTDREWQRLIEQYSEESQDHN